MKRSEREPWRPIAIRFPSIANSAIISRLSTSDSTVWPGGEPTPTNKAVIGWTASSTTAPYCGDVLAAQKISALLDEIGPAVLLAHSAGGGSTFRVPDLNAKNVVGIVAFEAAGANPVAAGFNNSPPLITTWKTEPALPQGFAPVDNAGCPMQGSSPSKLVNYARVPIILVGSEKGLANADALKCQASVWKQAGVDASAVYLPDRGLKGGGHFSMAQLDTAKYAKATRATVHLSQVDGQLAFTVADDGAGFDGAAMSYGTGLQGMADRLDAIGGSFEITSTPGSGTTVTGRVPVDARTQAEAASHADSNRSGPNSDLGM